MKGLLAFGAGMEENYHWLEFVTNDIYDWTLMVYKKFGDFCCLTLSCFFVVQPFNLKYQSFSNFFKRRNSERLSLYIDS